MADFDLVFLTLILVWLYGTGFHIWDIPKEEYVQLMKVRVNSTLLDGHG